MWDLTLQCSFCGVIQYKEQSYIEESFSLFSYSTITFSNLWSSSCPTVLNHLCSWDIFFIHLLFYCSTPFMHCIYLPLTYSLVTNAYMLAEVHMFLRIYVLQNWWIFVFIPTPTAPDQIQNKHRPYILELIGEGCVYWQFFASKFKFKVIKTGRFWFIN